MSSVRETITSTPTVIPHMSNVLLILSSSEAVHKVVAVVVGIVVVITYIVDNNLVKLRFRSTINDGSHSKI